jgi:hypothetical protein
VGGVAPTFDGAVDRIHPDRLVGAGGEAGILAGVD